VPRLPDWPARLAALLAAVEDRPFDAQRWNCGTFALAAVEACTGARPRYRFVPAAAEASADSAGFPRIPPAFARAGDVALGGEDLPRLGVVVNAGRVAFVGPRGLVREPITACRVAWSIG
jgi:hypothetical protein